MKLGMIGSAVQLSYLESLRDVMQAWAELRLWIR